MQAMVEIPEAMPGDSETVMTALETAALFRSKGEANEALRWLQRAAESASEDGNDDRTLSLARIVSELSFELQGGSLPLPSRTLPRLPKPPPRTASASPTPPSEAPASGRLQPPPKPDARPQRRRPPGHTPPPPPSARHVAAEQRGPGVTSAPPVAPSVAASSAAAAALRARPALRVCVRLDPHEPRGYRVHALGDAEAVPSDASEGLLILIDPKAMPPE